MLGRADQRLVDINAMALNAAIRGSILADPEGLLRIEQGHPENWPCGELAERKQAIEPDEKQSAGPP